MDFIWNSITDWLKEVLVSGIVSNLSGMFDSTNEQIGQIAGQVGLTPQAWNSGIFNMIQNLSNNVILPLAGAILAVVMTLELIQLITDRNNLNDVDTWMFFKWVFKSAAAVLIVSNTWTIVMGIFDAAQIDLYIQERSPYRGPGVHGSYRSVGHRIGIAPQDHCFGQGKQLIGRLSHFERNQSRFLGGILDGSTAGLFGLIRILGQFEGSHDLVEGTAVLIDESQELIFQGTRLPGHFLHFFLGSGILFFAQGQLGHHGNQGCGRSRIQSSDAAAPGCRGRRGRFVDKTFYREFLQFHGEYPSCIRTNQ